LKKHLKEPPHRKKLQEKQTKLRKEQELRAVRKIKEAAPNPLTHKTSRFPLTQLTNNACKLQTILIRDARRRQAPQNDPLFFCMQNDGVFTRFLLFF
jgi:hypothetical protein